MENKKGIHESGDWDLEHMGTYIMGTNYLSTGDHILSIELLGYFLRKQCQQNSESFVDTVH